VFSVRSHTSSILCGVLVGTGSLWPIICSLMKTAGVGGGGGGGGCNSYGNCGPVKFPAAPET
jgi:hypothetical protein